MVSGCLHGIGLVSARVYQRIDQAVRLDSKRMPKSSTKTNPADDRGTLRRFWDLIDRILRHKFVITVVAGIFIIVAAAVPFWKSCLDRTVSPAPLVAIERPSNGSTVAWNPATASGQGGRVEVELAVTGLADQETVLLTVTPDGFAETPQWGESATYDGSTPKWRGSLQIGNENYPPKSNEWFEAKAYIITTEQYAQHCATRQRRPR